MSLSVDTRSNGEYVITVGQGQIESFETALILGLLAMKRGNVQKESHEELEAFLKALSVDIDLAFFGSVLNEEGSFWDFQTLDEFIQYCDSSK